MREKPSTATAVARDGKYACALGTPLTWASLILFTTAAIIFNPSPSFPAGIAAIGRANRVWPDLSEDRLLQTPQL